MAQPQAAQDVAQRARKPMYEDEHASCSVLLAKIRNEECLLTLPPHDQFRWLHRFYLVLDRIAEQHRVYKLYGGPHGFMISTGVAEPDADHAVTLLRFALHLLQASQSIRLPGQVPMDLVMVMASGASSSGLLGTTSLTYQIVGRSVSVARELLETQLEVPFLVTRGMYDELRPTVASELQQAGSVHLRCCPGEQEAVYTLPRYGRLRLTQPAVPGVQSTTAEAAAAEAAPGATESRPGSSAPGTPSEPANGLAGAQPKQQVARQGQGQAEPANGGAGVAAGDEGPGCSSAAAAVQKPLPGASAPVPVPAPEPASCEQWAAAADPAAQAGPSSGSLAQEVSDSRRLQRQLSSEQVEQVPQQPKGQQGKEHHAPPGPAAGPAELPSSPLKCAEGKGQLQQQQQAGAHDSMGKSSTTSLPCNTHSFDAWLESDLLLRFEDPAVEASFMLYSGQSQQAAEVVWMVLGVGTALLYALASMGSGEGVPFLRIAQFQLVPLLGGLLWFYNNAAYLRCREGLWFLQRFVVLLATSLPTSFVFSQPGAMPLFAFGLCNLTMEMLMRRLRLHLQLLSSMIVYAATMVLMGLHEEGSPASRELITPSYLSTHLLITCVLPVVLTACCDYVARLSFQSSLAQQRRQQQLAQQTQKQLQAAA